MFVWGGGRHGSFTGYLFRSRMGGRLAHEKIAINVAFFEAFFSDVGDVHDRFGAQQVEALDHQLLFFGFNKPPVELCSCQRWGGVQILTALLE